jgi:hypothetical protein
MSPSAGELPLFPHALSRSLGLERLEAFVSPPGVETMRAPVMLGERQMEVAVVVRLGKTNNRFLGTQAAAEYSGIPAGTLRAWRCQGVGPRFYKPRGRALYDIADLDDFIRSGIRVSSVRASKEERNVYLPTG